MTDATTDPSALPDPATLPFERALEELERIVSSLERGDVPLDDTLARFERGMALARRCEARLDEAEHKVAVLVRRGAAVVEQDLHSGEELARHAAPGAAPSQATLYDEEG